MSQDSSLNPFPASARDVAERAAGVLGPESSLFEDLDAAGFGDALTQAIRATVTNPLVPVQAASQLAADLAQIPLVAATRWFGRETEPPVPVDARDRRFADQAWTDNPLFYGVRLAYLVVQPVRPGGGGRVEPGSRRGPQGGDVRRADAGRGGADQLPADQPGRAQARLRHRRHQPGQGGPAVPRRPDQQRGPAAPGRRQRVRGGPEPGVHAGQGGVPQRADGAHPVRAADRAGARHTAALQPAVDQQVLRDGPGPEAQLHRVGGAARPHRVRDQLPQPVGGHVRHHHGRLPGARPEDRAGRDPGDHRGGHRRHRRTLSRRRPHRDHRRLSDAGRGRPDRHADPAQHHARLRGAGRARYLHRPLHRGEAGEEDGQGGHAAGRSPWPARSTSCGPTT